MVALANTAGGRILLGVRDDGTVKGIADTNQLRARIQDIARNCDPPIKILLQRIGEITAVTVRESDAKPVQCSDGFFWRQGAVSQKLSREEIRDLFQQVGPSASIYPSARASAIPMISIRTNSATGCGRARSPKAARWR